MSTWKHVNIQETHIGKQQQDTFSILCAIEHLKNAVTRTSYDFVNVKTFIGQWFVLAAAMEWGTPRQQYDSANRQKPKGVALKQVLDSCYLTATADRYA